MKRKINILEKIQREVFKGFKRIYWFNYTRIKYYTLTLNKFIRQIETNNNKISLLLPSKERSNKFKRMMDSLSSTVHDKSRIEILILLDKNEKEKDLYKNLIKDDFKNFDIKIFEENIITHAKRNNFLAKKSIGSIIFPINDDIIFVSKFWDYFIDLEFSKIDRNKPMCLWINSGKKYDYLHTDFPIVNKKWFETLNYIGSENFNFWYLDTWICALSHISKRFIVTNKISVKQFSADTFENEVDNTFLLNRKDGIPEKDFEIWNNTKNERKIEAKKLA